MMPAAAEDAKQRPLQRFLAPFAASRAFLFLWLGHMISFLGSSITMVILPVLIYSLTGSTTIMGMIMAAYMLPNVIMLPISGHIVDRYDRVRIMMLADVARFLIMAATAVLSLTGVLSIPMLYGLFAIYGLLDGLFQPAYAAMRATVFTPDIRIAANSLTQMTTQAIRLLGPSLGGLLVTHFAAGTGFGLDAFSYLISLVCLIFLRRVLTGRFNAASAPAAVQTALPVKEKTSGDWKGDFKEGLAVLRSHPWLWITILAFSFINICYGGVTTVLVPWLFKVHHGWSPSVYGLALTFSGVGALCAGFIYGLRSSWKHRGWMAYGGVLLSGLALLALPFAPNPAVAIALFALEGFGLMIFGLIWEISLQELVPQEAFGRVASLDMLGSFALLPVGYIVVGSLADAFGGVITMALFALTGIACTALVLMNPAIRKFQ